MSFVHQFYLVIRSARPIFVPSRCVSHGFLAPYWKFVQAKSKQAMKQVLGIKDEAARMKVTPPLAVAPLAHGDDMRWNPNDDGINFNP